MFLVDYESANNIGDTTATSSQVATGQLAPSSAYPTNTACEICLSVVPYSGAVQNHQLESHLSEEQQANVYVDNDEFDDNMNVIYRDWFKQRKEEQSCK